MSETVETALAPATPPASATITPEMFPAIEPGAGSQPEIKTSAFEKISAVAGKVFERHGVLFRKTGGRPRKDGMPNKGDLALNAPATALPAAAVPPAALPAQDGLDPALVKKVCGAVIKGITGFLDKLLFNRAKSAGVDSLEAQDIVRDCSITQAEVDSFSELAEVCLRKYGVGTQYAPEIGLACVVLGVGARYSLALKTVQPTNQEDEAK